MVSCKKRRLALLYTDGKGLSVLAWKQLNNYFNFLQVFMEFRIYTFDYKFLMFNKAYIFFQSLFVDLDHDMDKVVSLDEFLDEMSRPKPEPKT